MSDAQLSLFPVRPKPEDADDDAGRLTPDAAARAFAVDPSNNVVLEASAGTGKTSVLVARYVNLVTQGVEPSNILAITFTRRAAAEMRERIAAQLREAASRSAIAQARWTGLRDRLGEIAISTIDAFCLSLLREFPLEADLDPGFDLADETEVPRIIDDALDRALRILVRLAREDAEIALVLAQLGIARTRAGLASLLDRRLVAWSALDRFLARGPSDLTPAVVCHRAVDALQHELGAIPGGLPQFLADGPARHGRYQLFTREVTRLLDWHHSGADRPGNGSGSGAGHLTEAEIRGLLERVGSHFLTNDGDARRTGRIPPYVAADYPTRDAERRHRDAVFQAAPQIERTVRAFHRDLNVVLARGVRRMFAVALQQYRTALEERSVLDFSDVLERALDLLRNMGEFSQSRYRLEYRYHHVLVDEFQDTSRAQWELISLLIRAWGEGLGLASRPSIFIVGDRKQSIYRFRDAEVAVLRDAARYIDGLKPGVTSRRAISHSFRAVPVLQAFVNDVFTEISAQIAPAVAAARPDDFTFEASDRFPMDATVPSDEPVLGLAVGDSADVCAAAVADEVRRILDEDVVRDRGTGVRRRAAPGDIAILFRSRTSHREFERELIARGVPTYVYKGLGFFDSDEIKDLTALLRYLANPGSDLRAAALLRSRFFRLSDAGLAALAPDIAASITDQIAAPLRAALDDADRRVLEHARQAVPSWIARVDRVPPSDLLEQILSGSAYAYEIRGPRRLQAWENIKKLRGLVRRMQNRGYATIARVSEHLDSLGAGDESNAVLEAVDAVNLMTVHASKGLEFPIVFIVNLAKGASGPPRPIRVTVDGEAASVSVGRFASDMDEADREREKHETRRLLYVGMTRARDRLYLSTSLKDGALVPGRGSLAEVLPASVRDLFAQAACALEGITRVASRGTSGTTFEWRLCRNSQPPLSPRSPTPSPQIRNSQLPTPNVQPAGNPGVECRASGVGARVDAPLRTSVTTWLREEAPSPYLRGVGTDTLIGTLVHRLFQLGAGQGELKDEGAWMAAGFGLLKPEERASTTDVDATVKAAVNAWRRLSAQPELAHVLASGELVHEVPFSMVDRESQPPVILRGTIDCLVRRPDGSLVVVEFKTGRASAMHERQLDIYVRAMQASFPAAPVERLLVYL
jgi:ATP-dependent helicase/nuclease subunit A